MTLCTITNELKLAIISYLDVPSLGRLCVTCRQLNAIVDENSLWQRHFPSIQIESGTSLKRFIGNCAVRSISQLIESFEQFTHTLPMNVSGEFTCMFPIEPQSMIRANLLLKQDTMAVHEIGLSSKKIVIFLSKLPQSDIKNYYYDTENNYTYPKGPNALPKFSISAKCFVKLSYEPYVSLVKLPYGSHKPNKFSFGYLLVLIMFSRMRKIESTYIPKTPRASYIDLNCFKIIIPIITALCLGILIGVVA